MLNMGAEQMADRVNAMIVSGLNVENSKSVPFQILCETVYLLVKFDKIMHNIEFMKILCSWVFVLLLIIMIISYENDRYFREDSESDQAMSCCALGS